MVLQKRLDYGFNGYQVPAIPRAARSARRRSSVRKKGEENPMCAFDLLATVAGKLLLEGEISPTAASNTNTSTGKDQYAVVNSNDEKEGHNEEESMKLETFDQGSCDKGYFLPEIGTQAHIQDHHLKDSPLHQNDTCSGLAASVVTSSGCLEKVNCAEKLGIGETKNETGAFACKVEVGFTGFSNSSNCKLGDDIKRQIKTEPLKSSKVSIGTGADMCNSEDPMVWDGKPIALISSDSSAKAPLCKDHIPCGSFPPSGDDVKLVSRDDDENSSGCTHPSTTSKSFRPAPRIGHRRIRKFMPSKYWKVAPRLKHEEVYNTSGELKPIYRIRKTCYKRQRSQRNYPFKKRRLFSSISNSGRGISSGGISCSLGQGINGDAFGSGSKMHGATGTSSSAAGQNTLFQSRDSHVKLRIKSFRVPELFIEIPETATVGSLKRRVMEAVTAILGGGLRVGVLLQGKKVRDDNKTLLQTGISHDNQLDALGFALEPNSSQAPSSLCTGDTPCLLPLDAPEPLTRYLPASAEVHPGSSDVLPDPSMTNLVTFVESDHDSAPSPSDMSIDKSTTDSKALVAVPAMSVEALAMVPMHRKSKRSDAAQRRIRRPFSVSEVESLVQAVEKLGTGRWRDVKLRAFDNAKHRTYVDLKDKWKTLVHTARISPQQRRGEPVPQELLDRVLTAHSYWTQQQAKQQLKNQSETCLLF